VGTGERGVVAGRDAREGSDILPDRVVNLAEGEVEADLEGLEMTDLDAEDLQVTADRDAAGDER
jgi:hypothetical protein